MTPSARGWLKLLRFRGRSVEPCRQEKAWKPSAWWNESTAFQKGTAQNAAAGRRKSSAAGSSWSKKSGIEQKTGMKAAEAFSSCLFSFMRRCFDHCNAGFQKDRLKALCSCDTIPPVTSHTGCRVPKAQLSVDRRGYPKKGGAERESDHHPCRYGRVLRLC